MLGSVGLGLGSVGTAAEAGGGSTEPTTDDVLSQVYANGASDPQTYDLFAMPSGNLRFLGNSGSGGVPGVGFYESATDFGDQRLATWFTRRYMRVGIGVGQTIGDALVGFDPLWDGTFPPLNGIKLTAARAGFTGTDDQTSANMAVDLGDLSFQSAAGFFNGPSCFPTPGFNAGNVEFMVIDLWQGASQALRNAFGLNGWGQIISRPLPLANGITAICDARADWAQIAPAANDGLGIMFRRGDDDPPCAMIDAHMLAANPFGDWGLALWARSSGALQEIASFDWTNGIQFFAPLATFGGGRGVQTFQSPLLDVTVPSSTTLVPQIAGFRFIPQNFGFVCVTASGVTGNPTVQADVGATSMLPSQAFPATGLVANQRSLSLTLASPIFAPDMGSAGLVFQITAGATATALTGRFFVTGVLAPI